MECIQPPAINAPKNAWSERCLLSFNFDIEFVFINPYPLQRFTFKIWGKQGEQTSRWAQWQIPVKNLSNILFLTETYYLDLSFTDTLLTEKCLRHLMEMEERWVHREVSRLKIIQTTTQEIKHCLPWLINHIKRILSKVYVELFSETFYPIYQWFQGLLRLSLPFTHLKGSAFASLPALCLSSPGDHVYLTTTGWCSLAGAVWPLSGLLLLLSWTAMTATPRSYAQAALMLFSSPLRPPGLVLLVGSWAQVQTLRHICPVVKLPWSTPLAAQLLVQLPLLTSLQHLLSNPHLALHPCISIQRS